MISFLQLFLGIIEYFSVFSILLKQPPEVIIHYFNHVHILEYEAVKSKKEYIDENLNEAYWTSINLFKQYHGITQEIAQKEYAKPYSWAYKVIHDENGDYYKYLSTMKVREFVFSQYFSFEEINLINRYIKTADLSVHPTSTYLYELVEADMEDSNYNKALFRYSIIFISAIFECFQRYANEHATIGKLTRFYLRTLCEINFERIISPFRIENNYNAINQYTKVSHEFINPQESAKLLLDRFNEENVSYIPYIQNLHYRFFSLDSFELRMFEHLDKIYAVIDVLFTNIYHFFPVKLNMTCKLDNIRRLYWIIALIQRELSLTYAFKLLPLFQKAYRLLIEYCAILFKLLISTDEVNQAFKDLAYILLDESIFVKDYDKKQSEMLLKRVSKLLKINSDKEMTKAKDFMGWTIYKNKKNKLVKSKLKDIVDNFIQTVDPHLNVLDIIMQDCNLVLHAGLYGLEINNDLLHNSRGIIDYVVFIEICNTVLLEELITLREVSKDSKLVESYKLIIYVLKNEVDEIIQTVQEQVKN